MNNEFNKPIFILGAPRSGTSIIAGILDICGAWSGITLPATEANPSGFFENRQLRNKVIKPILEKLDCDPLGVRKLPALESLQKIPNLANVVYQIICEEGYTDNTPWIFKEPKLSLIWPIFMFGFPDARWIIVRRETADIVRSCIATDFMSQHSSNNLYWENFVQSYLERLEILKINVKSSREIWPSTIINSSFEPIEELVYELGLSWRKNEVIEFINKTYWHSS